MAKEQSFQEVKAGQTAFWLPVTDLRPATGWPIVPLADTELLATAHHIPVVVTVNAFEIAVGACLDDRMLLHPAVHPDTGAYGREYCPVLLRALPFRLPDFGNDLEIDSDYLVENGDGARPIFGADGKLEPAVERTQALLQRQRSGCLRLAQAASMLFAANLLVELPSPNESDEGFHYFTVDADAYSALQPLQMMGLGTGGWLALDLAASIIFSRRLLRPKYQTSLQRGVDVAPGQLTPEIIDQLVRSVGQLDFKLDESELIELQSFDLADPITGPVVNEAAVRS